MTVSMFKLIGIVVIMTVTIMRVSVKWYEVARQLRSSATAAAGEPGWNGPTPAELNAVADEIENTFDEVRQKLLDLKTARTVHHRSVGAGRDLMRRVDLITTALYGRGAGEKNRFGLRPEDLTRNIYPLPDAPSNLRLLDHEDGLMAKWKGKRRGNYEIQVYRDAELSQLGLTLFSTSQSTRIPGLSPGTEVYVRVRTRLSGRWSEWSEVARRFVNPV